MGSGRKEFMALSTFSKMRTVLVMCSVFVLRYVFKTHTFASRYMRNRYRCLIHKFLLSILYSIL